MITPELKELKYAYRAGKKTCFVLEYEPQVRTIVTSHSGNFRLSFPYLIFIIAFDGKTYQRSSIVARHVPLGDINNPVFRLPLSNIYREPDKVGLCMHTTTADGNIIDKLKSIVTAFWLTSFTGTRSFSVPASNAQIHNYQAWERSTKRNPNFVKNPIWEYTGFTLKELVKKTTLLKSFSWEEKSWERKKQEEDAKKEDTNNGPEPPPLPQQAINTPIEKKRSIWDKLFGNWDNFGPYF
jgi:hypothetical protein